MCGRRDRAQNEVLLRNVVGGKEESGSVANSGALFFSFFSLFFFFFFFSFLNHMFIVPMVQEMTCIFNDMAKTKPKIKHNLQPKKTNIPSFPNATNNRCKAAVAKTKESINC